MDLMIHFILFSAESLPILDMYEYDAKERKSYSDRMKDEKQSHRRY